MPGTENNLPVDQQELDLGNLTPTRGERNHNPLNINYRKTDAWNGQDGIEIVPSGMHFTPRFGRYESDFFGIRAGAKQLWTDNTKHGLHCLRTLISDETWGWAPEFNQENVQENDSEAYVDFVCKQTGIGPDELIDLSKPLVMLAVWPAFCKRENGRCLYAPSLIQSAVYNALGLIPKQE